MNSTRHTIQRRTAAGLALGLAAAYASLPQNVRAADAPAVTTRSYDIRDFLVQIPDFYGPQLTMGLGLSATSEPHPRPTTMPTREDQLQELMAAIRGSVAPESWREAGGTVGSMEEKSGQLVVTQTEDNHRRVAELLELLRDARAVQLTVETRFLAVDPDQLDADTRAILGATKAGQDGAFLDDRQVQDVLRGAMKTKTSTLLTAPRLTLFSSQTAYVMIAQSQPFVSGYAREEKGGTARFVPTTQTTNAGWILDVQGTVTADRKNVRLTVRPRATAIDGVDKIPFEGDRSLSLDRPLVREIAADTSIEVPDGKTAVLRMASLEDKKGGTTFILLKPTVILQKESRPRPSTPPPKTRT